jgi:multidrug efflux system outer membrane protein
MASLAKAALVSREASFSLVDSAQRIGGANDFEVQQAISARESAFAGLDSIEFQRAAAQNRLNYLVGLTPDDLPEAFALDAQGLDAQLSPGLPAEVLLMRPDVIAAEHRLSAAHANINAARAAFFPKVLLTAGVGLASQGLAGLFTAGAWNFQPMITLPLFDGGRLSSGVELAQARKVIAVAEYERTIQLAFREVADLLAARDSMVRQVRAAQANQKALERRVEISKARHSIGLASLLEVLDAERDLAAVRQTSAQVRRAQLDVAAQLYKALGGGQSDVQVAAGS